jgi:hypothetical protein
LSDDYFCLRYLFPGSCCNTKRINLSVKLSQQFILGLYDNKIVTYIIYWLLNFAILIKPTSTLWISQSQSEKIPYKKNTIYTFNVPTSLSLTKSIIKFIFSEVTGRVVNELRFDCVLFCFVVPKQISVSFIKRNCFLFRVNNETVFFISLRVF